MKIALQTTLLLAASTLFGLSAFQTPAPVQDPPKPIPSPTPKPEPKPEPEPEPEGRRPLDATIRFSGIPGADKEELAKQYAIVTEWLAKDFRRKFEFVPVKDYAEAVEGLASNKLDVVWLNGASAVQAELETKGRCQPIVCREEDLKFKTYFIGNKKLVDSGTFTAIEEKNPMPLEALGALKPKFATLSFTFGDKLSTSGHLMPRYFLERPEVGINPEKDFESKPGYALTGGHSSVLADVASGAFDVGALDSLSWEKAKDELKVQAPVIYVTPEYVGYCMVSHVRNGPTLSLRVMSAFVRLDPKKETDKAVLEVFGTKKFVAIGPGNFDGIREIVKSTKERGILEK